MIKHLSYYVIKCYPKNLYIINQQFYNALSDQRFWKLYTKDILIENVLYITAVEWIKEVLYIQYINDLIDNLSKSSSYCQVVVEHRICGYVHCNHQLINVINNGRIIIDIDDINTEIIDLFKTITTNYTKH